MKQKIWQASAHLEKQFFFFSVAAYSQTVTGTVTDTDNKPIAKATIQVKGRGLLKCGKVFH